MFSVPHNYLPSPPPRHWHSEHSSAEYLHIRESPQDHSDFTWINFYHRCSTHNAAFSRFLSYRSYIIGRFNPCVRSAGWKQIFSLFRKQYRRWKSCANNEIDWTRFGREKRRKIKIAYKQCDTHSQIFLLYLYIYIYIWMRWGKWYSFCSRIFGRVFE